MGLMCAGGHYTWHHLVKMFKHFMLSAKIILCLESQQTIIELIVYTSTHTHYLNKIIYRISRTIRRTMIFSLDILEKNNDVCILILVIYWKKTGLVHTKISNHNIIYSS